MHLVNNVTPLIFWRNLILDAGSCYRTFSVLTEFSRPWRDTVGEKEQRLFRKLKGLLFFENSRVTTTE